MLCLPYYCLCLLFNKTEEGRTGSAVFSSTKLEKRVEQVLPGSEGREGEGGIITR
jgi:hypothetical protein